MKLQTLALLVLITACGKAPEQPSLQSQAPAPMKGEADAIVPPANVTLDETQAESIIKEAEEKIQIAEAASPAATISQEPSSPGTPAAPKPDFMSDAETKVNQAFASGISKSGKQLSAQQVDLLTASFMQVINASKSKNPFAMASSWNGFVKTVKAANLDAQANNPGGLITDIQDFAIDVVKLAADLLIAVLKLDVAGVFDVALDAVELVIDFLI